MPRLIDADLIQYEPMLSPKGNGQYEEVSVAYKSQIDDLPTIEERKKGKWHSRIYSKIEMFVCSECQHEYSYDAETGEQFYNYCPNCGARMKKPMTIPEEIINSVLGYDD